MFIIFDSKGSFCYAIHAIAQHTHTHTSCMMNTTESTANTLDEFNGIYMWPNTLERIRTQKKYIYNNKRHGGCSMCARATAGVARDARETGQNQINDKQTLDGNERNKKFEDHSIKNYAIKSIPSSAERAKSPHNNNNESKRN